MDRDAIARAQRSREAGEALEFERERVGELKQQIEAIVAELAGPGVEQAAFATMTPEDVEAVRAVLHPDMGLGPEEDWLAFEGEQTDTWDEAEEDTGGDAEEEIARLQVEIAASRKRQEALERYLEALGATSPQRSSASASDSTP